jgi:hypothetical protein
MNGKPKIDKERFTYNGQFLKWMLLEIHYLEMSHCIIVLILCTEKEIWQMNMEYKRNYIVHENIRIA